MAGQATEKKGKVNTSSYVPDYLKDGKYRLSFPLKKIETLQEPNRTYALEYVHFLELKPSKSPNAQNRTIARRASELLIILGHLPAGLDAKQATVKDIEGIVLALKNSSMAPKSREMTKLMVKNFWAYLAGIRKKRRYPEIVDWIEIQDVKNTKTADDLLTPDEISRLLSACKTLRDRTIISIFSTYGNRVGELLALRRKDCHIAANEKDRSWITFTGKTGTRRLPIFPDWLCYPYLRDYLKEYKSTDPNTPLFTSLSHNGSGEMVALDYPEIQSLIRRLKKWTGITKRIHSHLWRFTNITKVDGKYPEAITKALHGLSPDSRQLKTYSKPSEKWLFENMQSLEGNLANVIVCTACSVSNPITNRNCGACGEVLYVKADANSTKLKQMENEIEKLKQQMGAGLALHGRITALEYAGIMLDNDSKVKLPPEVWDVAHKELKQLVKQKKVKK